MTSFAQVIVCCGWIAVAGLNATNLRAAAPDVQEQTIFERGRDGYNNIRIPALCVTTRGTLLAFAEGREGGDAGDIDLIMRRSTDGGKTWSDIQVVWNDADNTCGNPAPIVDQQTGAIWLFLTWNIGSDSETKIMTGVSQQPRRVYLCKSDDDGQTWTDPQDLSETLRHDDWRWYATGPGIGIQLTRGPHAGRLICPANHSVLEAGPRDPHMHHSHVIYSDDHGASWQLGATHDPLTNESAVVELADGSLMQNMRSYHDQHNRAVAISADGGATFGDLYLDDALQSPVCQGSMLRYSWPEDGTSRILFAAPAGQKRDTMTVRLSYDEGKTWPVQRVIYSGPAAYSSLAKLPDNRIGLLYEKDNYGRIVLASFPVTWLENDALK